MYNDDYVILVDENGQPYIAHAFGDGARAKWGSLKGRAAKYIEKVKTKSGKWRYFYSPDELKAFYNEKKYSKNKNIKNTEDLQKAQKAKYTADQARKRVQGNRQEAVKKAKKSIDDIGIDDALRYAKAKRKGVKNTEDLQKYQSAEYQWKNSKLGKASNTINKNAKTTLANIRNFDAKGAAKKAGKAVDDLGIDELYRYAKANRNKNMTGQQKAQYQREWKESALGKLTNKKKKK